MDAVELDGRGEVVRVQAGSAAYPVVIGSRLLDDVGRRCRGLGLGRRALVISDEPVASLYGEGVVASLRREGFLTEIVAIPAGEAQKSLETASRLYDACLDAQLDRSSFVAALGGGVVGDLAGFVAATYMRGIDFVQIPTTLLAQVDASVGGKTGVNHPRGKNLIGAFHQPRGVFVDVDALKSLPIREYRAGLAEVIKYGLIADAELFAYCEAEAEALAARDGDSLRRVVRRSVEIKGRVVEADEKEAGLRAILNFGHTVGHAIEAATEYRRYMHGEAVAIGMVVEARMSVALGLLPEDALGRTVALLERVGLPTRAEGVDAETVVERMSKDKKAVDGQLRFALIDGVGSARVVDDAPASSVFEAYRWHESR